MHLGDNMNQALIVWCMTFTQEFASRLPISLDHFTATSFFSQRPNPLSDIETYQKLNQSMASTSDGFY